MDETWKSDLEAWLAPFMTYPTASSGSTIPIRGARPSAISSRLSSSVR